LLPGLSIIPDVAATNSSLNGGDRYVVVDSGAFLEDLDHSEFNLEAASTTAIKNQQHQQQIIEMLDENGGIVRGGDGVSVISLNRLINPRRKLSTASSSSSSSSSSSTSSARSSPQQIGMMSSSSTNSNNNNNNNTTNAELNTINKQSNEFVDFDEIAENPDAILLDFKCPLSEEKEVEWRTLFLHGSLYVQIPASCLPEGSRDSFISLLEFAEQKLECERVFVCFERKRIDRTALMRVFMFLGFTVVPPNNPMVPQNDDIMSMVYNID
jgi:ornithine decarboxylase antizyme 1